MDSDPFVAALLRMTRGYAALLRMTRVVDDLELSTKKSLREKM
jgi:hypothetical protein